MESGADWLTEREFVELPAVFVDSHHIHFVHHDPGRSSTRMKLAVWRVSSLSGVRTPRARALQSDDSPLDEGLVVGNPLMGQYGQVQGSVLAVGDEFGVASAFNPRRRMRHATKAISAL